MFVGIPSINNRVRECNFLGSRVDLSEGSIDAQKSDGTNILIVVNGEIALPGKSARPFVQTFFLAGQGGGTSFYCRNSILRLLPVPEPVVVQAAPQPVVAPAPVVPQFQSSAPAPIAAPAPVAAPIAAPAPVAEVTADLRKLTVQPVVETVHVPEPVVEEEPEDKGPKSYLDMLKRGTKTAAAPKAAAPAIKVVKAAPKPAPAAAKPAEGSSSNGNGKPADNGASKPKPAAKPVSSIYIRNVPKDATKEELQEAFSVFGAAAIKRVDVVNDRNIAFIDFDSEETVKKVLAQTNATPMEFKGAALKIEERKPVQPKKAGDGKSSGKGDSGRDGGKPRGDRPSGDKPKGPRNSAPRAPKADE